VWCAAQVLKDVDEAPQLPASYPAMAILVSARHPGQCGRTELLDRTHCIGRVVTVEYARVRSARARKQNLVAALVLIGGNSRGGVRRYPVHVLTLTGASAQGFGLPRIHARP